MKPALRLLFRLSIVIASFLSAATLMAQSCSVSDAYIAFSSLGQRSFWLESNGTVSITGSVSLATVDGLSHSQRPPIPFAEIQRAPAMPITDVQLNSDHASLAVPVHLPTLPERLASASSSAGFNRAPAVRKSGALDAGYVWLNGIQFSLVFADIATTQHCIDEHTCREGNPLMPSSLAGKFSVSLGIAAFASAASYRLKKEHSRSWWVAPTFGIAGHAVGLASGLIHW